MHANGLGIYQLLLNRTLVEVLSSTLMQDPNVLPRVTGDFPIAT